MIARVADNRRGLAAAIIRFVIIAASIEPARRIRNELPFLFRLVRPACGARPCFFHQGRKDYQSRTDDLSESSLSVLGVFLFRIDRIPSCKALRLKSAFGRY